MHVSEALSRALGGVELRALLQPMLAACDSPIEADLLVSAAERGCNAWCAERPEIGWRSCSELPGGENITVWAVQWRTVTLYLHPRIGKWTPDFVLVVPTYRREVTVYLNVECDGHQFHERTKEQAQRDRRKDRDLVRLGYLPVRFTGSEIHGGAADCVDELFSVASDAVYWQRERGEEQARVNTGKGNK